MTIRLLRKTQVLSKYGKSHSGFYADIASKLMVPPVKLGARISAWPEHEVDAVLRARIAGKTPDQIRELVTQLLEERKILSGGGNEN